MPYCEISGGEHGLQIFYTTYGHGPIKVLMLIGLAATHETWMPQIKWLTGTDVPNDEHKSIVDDQDVISDNGIQVCGLDNRGVGRSSVPADNSEYSTTLMAKDAIAVMNHLGWRKAHVIGHSMGTMIALKLAALVPYRVSSLAVINTSGGGYEMLPKPSPLVFSVVMRFLLAKSPEEKAGVDLDIHFSQGYLDECVGKRTRRSLLYREYVRSISETEVQSDQGALGQLTACWKHEMTQTEYEQIRSGGFLVSVIHGSEDIVAPISRTKRFAERLFPFAKLVVFKGGHLVIRERPDEVNDELLKLIRASESKISPHDWTNLPDLATSDSCGARMLAITNSATRASLYSLERLACFLIYLIGVFGIVIEYVRRLVRRYKSVSINSSSKSQ